jgi:hypothetical protein
MGYNTVLLEEVLRIAKLYFNSFDDIQMLELGDQQFHLPEIMHLFSTYNYSPPNNTSKSFFDHINIKYFCIDYNGHTNTHYCDLKESSEDTSLIDSFNFITDIGTLEHVGENEQVENLLHYQYMALKNLHLFGKVGCLYYHALPMFGNWHKHGVCDYNATFWKDFCKLCNYTIIKEPFELGESPYILICIEYKKEETSVFPTFEQFCTLTGLRSTAND